MPNGFEKSVNLESECVPKRHHHGVPVDKRLTGVYSMKHLRTLRFEKMRGCIIHSSADSSWKPDRTYFAEQ